MKNEMTFQDFLAEMRKRLEGCHDIEELREMQKTLRLRYIADWEKEEAETGHSFRLKQLARYAEDGPEPDEHMWKFYQR